MANTLAQFGAQSATFVVPAVDEAFGFVGAEVVDGVNTDWASLPSGKLKSLLNKTYLSGEFSDFPSFFAAAADAGLFSVALTKVGSPATSASGDTVSWSLGAEGFPKATVVTDAPVNEYQLRIVASYSASE